MPIIEKSLEALAQRAADCADLAKAQRVSADKQQESANKLQESADKQHVVAHKTEALCKFLAENVAVLNEELLKPDK